MKQYKYIKLHNNYDLTLNKVYKGYVFKKGWLWIEDDDRNISVLCRESHFLKVE
jgi:hypothetical protein